jgi:hypothetical protein
MVVTLDDNDTHYEVVTLLFFSRLWPLEEIDRSTLVVSMCDVMMLPVAWSAWPWHRLRGYEDQTRTSWRIPP